MLVNAILVSLSGFVIIIRGTVKELRHDITKGWKLHAFGAVENLQYQHPIFSRKTPVANNKHLFRRNGIHFGRLSTGWFSNMLTWIEHSRPGKLTPGLIGCIESEAEIENSHALHLELQNIGKTDLCNLFVSLPCFLYQSFSISAYRFTLDLRYSRFQYSWTFSLLA